MAGDVTASSTTDGQAGTPTDTHGAQPASDAASTRAQAEATNDPWSTWGAAEEPQSWDEWGHQRWGDQGYDGSHGGSWGDASSNDSTDDSRRQTTTWRRAEPWRTDAWHGRQYSDVSTTWTSGNWSREATRDHSSWWQRDAWDDGWMGDRDWSDHDRRDRGQDDGATWAWTPSTTGRSTATTPAFASWATTGEVPGGRGRPTEKLMVPTFSGAGDSESLGASARSYMRQVQAWRRMTRLEPCQQGLVLYQNLAGPAWINAESLNMELLSAADGVEYLLEWVKHHYLDVEITLIGRSLSDLFRKLRRRSGQSFRDYAAEFNRLLARVTECNCRLPDVAAAWLYVDRATLDEGTEVSLMASVGNRYELKAVQQASIILDRASRKPWEKTGRTDGYHRKAQNVNQTEDVDEDNETVGGGADDFDEESEDVYMTYMTARSKYREATKARGLDNKDAESARQQAESRIQAAKNKSHCAACGQKGHGHRDPVCPKHGQGRDGGATGGAGSGKIQTIHVTNDIMELRAGDLTELHAVLDTACSKSVVGTAWLQKYLEQAEGKGCDAEFIYESTSGRPSSSGRLTGFTRQATQP